MRNDDHDGKGTYIIILYMDKGKSIQIGALGKYNFKRGYYAYVVSAFSPGGLKSRVKHHIEPKKSYHWHIDFLNPVFKEVWVSDHGARFEHDWATAIGETASNKILGFGCSDCSCESHLLYFKSMAILKKSQEYLCKNSHVRIARSQFLSDLKLERKLHFFRTSPVIGRVIKDENFFRRIIQKIFNDKINPTTKKDGETSPIVGGRILKIIHSIFTNIYFFISHHTLEEIFANKCQVENHCEQFKWRCTFSFDYTRSVEHASNL